MIVSSTYTEGPPQVDGRPHVSELHTDDRGQTYTYEWLGILAPERKAQIVSAGNG